MNSIENYSTSKGEKVGDDSQSRDLLSDLPLGIIHIILAFVPIREAVRTCVLSTQWRYTWTTLPHLVFDYSSEVEEVINEKFITHVLFRHKGPIHKFKLSCSTNFRYVDEWIFYLSRNGIQELECELILEVEMRPIIYSCKKLTYLRLYDCTLVPPPLTFKGFLFLRCLRLDMVGFSPDGIYSLVSFCPNLEIFELIDIDEFEVKISAPNLKYMNLQGYHEKICINAPLMTEISVDMTAYYIHQAVDQQRKILVCDYAKCFSGFTNLQKLFGSNHFTKYLSLGIELSHHSLVFHHLKLIDLHDVNFENVKEVLMVAHLVIGAPNLHSVKIDTQINWPPYVSGDHVCEDDESDMEAPHLSFKDLGCSSNFKLEKLTDVSLKRIKGLGMEVEFLKFLLESSPTLETMSVRLVAAAEGEWNNLMAKLDGCNWASPIVKLCKATWESVYDRPRLPFPLWDLDR